MTKVSRFFVFAVLLTLAAAAPAWGQETALTGTVKDPTGAVISGATVTVTNEATGAMRTATTDGDGHYLFSRLDPGSYKIEIKMQGFKTSQTPKVPLPVSITSRFDITMSLGDIAETVIVEAETARINTTDASLGNPFSGNEVRRLPMLDGSPAGLLSLQTGVTFVPTDPTGIGASNAEHRGGSVSGSRTDQSNVTLDGIDVNDPINGTAFFSALRVTQESLQEFRVTTTNSNADQGRSSAAQVTLVTKSGTNEIHGSAYYNHRNEALAANQFFNNKDGVPRDKLRRHLYGASLGGPIIKNRFFLFGNWEKMKELVANGGDRVVPAMHMRDGVFFYPCEDNPGLDGAFGTADDFLPCTGNSGNTVMGMTQMWTAPSGYFALSPAQINALDRGGPGANLATLTAWQALPEPNSPGFNDRVNLLGFRFTAPIENETNVYILRADYHLDSASNHTLFWRGTLMDDVNVAAPNMPGDGPFRSALNASKGFGLGYTAVISPTIVNNFRWGITRIKDGGSGNRSAPFVRHRFVDDTLGFFNSAFGTSSSFGRTIPQHHYRNDLTWTKGKHSFSFGAEARYTRNSRFSDAGSFHFSVINPSWLPDGGGEISPGHSNCSSTRPECRALPGSLTGDGTLRDRLTLMIAPMSQVTANYNFNADGTVITPGDAVPRRFAVDEYEFYGQDQWRMFSNVTVTYGLRWYYASPPWETNGNQVVPNPRISEWIACRENAMDSGLPSRFACGNLQMVLGGKENNGRPYYDPDTNNFSPRAAVAWTPQGWDWLTGNGKMTVRLGYTLVYDRIGNALAVGFDAAGSFGLATSLSNGLGSCSIGGASGRPLCPRFTDYLDTAAAFAGAPPLPPPAPQNNGLQPPPPASFPAVQPVGLSGVTNTIDDRLRTPYSHAATFSIARELPWNMAIEGAWVGRFGKKLPIGRDFAMQSDIRDPVSGMTWFEAEKLFVEAAANGVTLANIGTIPFWENFFPGFGPNGINGGCLGWEVLGTGCGFSATQVAYDYVMGYHGTGGNPGFGASTVGEDIDRFRFPSMLTHPGCTDISNAGVESVRFTVDSDGDMIMDSAPGCRFAIFPGQFVQLNGLTGIARSEYNSMQLTLRKRTSNGLLFNFNYTLSVSKDHGSAPERFGTGGAGLGGGTSGFMHNSWDLDANWGYSDFDMRHQFNSHIVYDLPFGRGRRWASGSNGFVNAVIGGWAMSTIIRANSGLPFTIGNGRTWPTNWNFSGNAVCQPSGAYQLGVATGPCPKPQNVKSSTRGVPNIFADPDAAYASFRFGAPGESGARNVDPLRGDKFINFDLRMAKTFNLPWESHRLEFGWDMFNIANAVYFDPNNLSADLTDQATFGDYQGVMGDRRKMQVNLRWVF